MADRRVEGVVVDVNVFVGGSGFLGVATSFTPPSINMSTVDSESSPAGKMKLSWGATEDLDAEFDLGEHSSTVYSEMSKLNSGEITFRKSSKQGENTINVEWLLKGQIVTDESDPIKRGEKNKSKVKIAATYYMKKINGSVVLEIDKPNGISKLDGSTDTLEEARNFIRGQ